MIVDVPIVKVSGINYPIYSIDYSWGGADSPSTVTIEFINKNGEYKEPTLGTAQVSEIEMGNFFAFSGYPVSYEHKFSNQGKTMSVVYWDKSIILDKVFVGLKGVHGTAPKFIGSDKWDGTTVYGAFQDAQHFVLVGNYVDPCDGVTASYEDPCNPCASQTEFISLQEDNVNKFIDCEKARYTQLLDVNYTFVELVAALRSKGIQFDRIPFVKTTFYGRYSGTAREVLKSWCSDLGWTFFWKDNAIHFIDLKTGITIRDTDFYTDCSLIASSRGESIEDNHATGNILYFGGEGDLREYNCSRNSLLMSLLPITLKDLFSGADGNLNPYISKYYSKKGDQSNITCLQIATVFSKYSRILRDLVLLYEYYEVTTVDDIPDDTDFPLLGMKIKETWDVGGKGEQGAHATELSKLFWKYIPESIRKKATVLGASMAIIEWNPEWYDHFYELEKSLANDFLGKYWISFFSAGDRFTYSAPDGTVNYFDAGTPMALPFVNLLPKSVIASSPYLARIINSSAALNKSSGHVGQVTTANPNSFAHSFLLMEREAAWEPTPQDENIRKFTNNYQDLHFYNVEPFKYEGFSDNLPANQFFVLIFDKPDTFTLVNSGDGAHPVERNNTNMKVEVDGITRSYGLRSDMCRAYQLQLDVNNNGDKDNSSWHYTMNFFMPAQSHDSFGVNFPGYYVIANSNSASDSQTNVFVKRLEVIKGDVLAQSADSVGIIINFKDLSSHIQTILTETASGCGYNANQIKSFIDSFHIASSRPKQIRRSNRSYTLSGFPTRKLTISDGLASFSVRYGTDSGITSELQFSNTPPLTVSDNIVNQEVENHILRRLLGRQALSSNNKVFLG